MSGEFPANSVFSLGRPGFLGVPKKVVAGVAPMSGAVLSLAVAAAATNNVDVAISFDTLKFDSSGFFHSGLPTTQLIAPAAGVYLLTGEVVWSASATGGRTLQILQGATVIAGMNLTNPSGTVLASQNISILANAAKNDTFTMHISQSSGGNLNYGGFASLLTFFGICTAP